MRPSALLPLPAGLLSLALLAACAGSTPAPHVATAPAVTAVPPADESFRETQPPPGPPVSFHAPVPKVLTLGSGLTVWLVERHDIPLASFSFVVNAGANANPQGLPGTSSFVAAMLDEGTTSRDAPQIARAFENIAAQFQATSDQETLTATLSVPSESIETGVTLFADVLRHPAFRPADVERVRNLRAGELTRELDDPTQVGRHVLARVVYGEAHPWAYPEKGTLEANRRIPRSALQAWHRTWVQPKNATLVVIGDVHESALVPLLERAFGGWKARPPPKIVLPPSAPSRTRTLVLVDRADASQSQVWIGRAGEPVSAPGLYATRVANLVLGGGPKGRLFAALRTGKAYSYGAYSGAFERREQAGLLYAAGGIVADKTPEAIQEFVKVMDGLAGKGLTNTDLAEAKAAIVQGLPARFESNEATAQAFGRARGLGFSPEHFAELPARVEAVTRAEADAAASSALATTGSTFVVVGPMKVLRARLEALDLGPVQIRDASGKLLSPPTAAAPR